MNNLYSDLNSELLEKNIEKVWFEKEDKLIRGDKKGELVPNWIVAIDFPLFETTDFLTISDQTGEPLYFQTKHRVYEIFKNEEGKYYSKIEETE
ncbi:MAG: hypothetical protein CMC87_08910 [Flavobacteriaceae bacterium]|uniref:Uncharacterized protein n=1 Tax=Mesonia oceanica TaxID=2687242 RepID=A0AC61Y727_9FLAO|nr:hypothetical protein [Flavobacteriaceae bacterium]VVV00297.1 hypothetical protein FVB9532_01566 [Mesonia oceanica]